MAAIGGVFNINGGICDGGALVRMSRAMSRRGRGSRAAVLLDRCGLFWGDGQSDSALCELGDLFVLCDGLILLEDEETGVDFFGESDSRMFAEAFGKYGLEVPEHIGGEYASAAYNRKKGELVLFGDREGLRPLYYSLCGSSVGFASEIKGLLAYLQEARVDRDILISHILSRYGQYSGEDIYRGINGVRLGSGLVISGQGISRFTYGQGRSRRCEETNIGEKRQLGNFVCPDEEGMKRMLCEILYAFDYPQFDCLMPTFLRDCSRAESDEGCVIDGALCYDIRYAAERRDRLSVMAGYRPRVVPPDRYAPRERELKNMEEVLHSLLSEADKEKLEYIFETDIVSEIMKIENMARRIRSLGMAIQSEIWYDGYRVTFDAGRRGGAF